jgi:hypothetical protein
VADELAVMLRDQPYQVRCLLARSRRLASGLPTVWEPFQGGDLDADQIRVIDRVARRVTEASTLAAIDERAWRRLTQDLRNSSRCGCCGW